MTYKRKIASTQKIYKNKYHIHTRKLINGISNTVNGSVVQGLWRAYLTGYNTPQYK